MKVVCLVCEKGGSGKTTLAIALAVAFAADGYRTRGLDIDPQATFVEWADNRGDYEPEVHSLHTARLNRALLEAENDGIEICIIDTPGRTSDGFLAAAKLADLAIAPFRPTQKDLATAEKVRDLIKQAGDPLSFALRTQVKPQGTRHLEAAEYLEHKGFTVCPHILGDRVAYQDPDIIGQAPQEYEPNGQAAKEIDQVYKYTCQLLGLQER